MSSNSSSSSNATLHQPPFPLTTLEFIQKCSVSTSGVFNITAFTIIGILFLLPLYILVLYLGHQQWRQQCSGSTMSHSDLFTYHMVFIELTNLLGSTITCCGVQTDQPQMLMLGLYVWSVNCIGQILFHILMCGERYLAATHPIIYLGLRKVNLIRIRNITICCVWMLSFAGTGLLFVGHNIVVIIFFFCFGPLGIIVMSFCSISVLCVLIHPGPGEGGGHMKRVDKSKLRAFYTIMIILGALVLRFGGSVLVAALSDSGQFKENERCGLWFSQIWLSLPCSLVLPLLFLHRAGKVQCCNNSIK